MHLIQELLLEIRLVSMVVGVTFLNIVVLKQFILYLGQWWKSYKGKDKLQRHMAKADDQEMLIDAKQVESYDEGEVKRSAISLLEKLSPELTLSRKDYCIVRDYLLVEIGLANAHRSGVAANMTLSEFAKHRRSKDNKVSIPVWNHKTVETYGAAPVILASDVFDHLTLYVQCARSQVCKGNDPHVFLSWQGKKMKSGDVSKRFHEVWKNSGNFIGREIPKQLCLNHVRKSVSTGIREGKSTRAKEVAAGMMHSVSTADAHYDLFNKEQATAIGE